MHWLKIELTGQEIGYTDRWNIIQDGFSEIYVREHASSDVAMFHKNRNDGGTVLYFTPAAANLAKDFLISQGAILGERPVPTGDIFDFGLIVGHCGSLDMFFSGAIDRE